VSVWAEVFLGIIAVTSLATAIIQVSVCIAASKLLKRLTRLTDQVDQELKPIFGHVNAIAKDAAHATALARAQVERADRLVNDLLQRAEQLVSTVQGLLNGPIRDGASMLTAFRAAFNAFRDFKGGRARARRPDDEDALFI
jgi:hypothetical protein